MEPFTSEKQNNFEFENKKLKKKKKLYEDDRHLIRQQAIFQKNKKK